MSITEKLRQAYHNDLTDVPLLLDAADEIERLQAELARAEQAARINATQADELQVEVDRLGKQLESEEWREVLKRAEASEQRWRDRAFAAEAALEQSRDESRDNRRRGRSNTVISST